MSSNFVLFKDYFVILGPLQLCINFRISLSVSIKKLAEILIGIVCIYRSFLGSCVNLIILSPLIHEH